MLQVSEETNFAHILINSNINPENHSKFPKKLLINNNGTEIKTKMNATVNIGITNKLIKMDKKEIPSKVFINIGKINSCVEIEIDRGDAKNLGILIFLIGFLIKL